MGIDETTADAKCPCPTLRVPNSRDTDIFCDLDSQPGVNGAGDWILNGSSACDVVCEGGQLFVPLQCKLGGGRSDNTAWHINYNGEDIALEDGTDCFSCRISNCDGNGGSSMWFAQTSVHWLYLTAFYLLARVTNHWQMKII